ncbi:MAG: hypothetical protein P4K93_14760 [Terracidiphilus sp.]|nr:hypothetical protein [Terracidiphilus sp.]MDR3799417.1 hypothetical protein [Terracidiphilus sp.]
MTIPHEYRFRSSEVSIRRNPHNGDIILTEGPGPWSHVFEALDAVDMHDDFLSQAERDRRPSARRPALEDLFATESVSRKKRK